jgi:hypothetical protein
LPVYGENPTLAVLLSRLPLAIAVVVALVAGSRAEGQQSLVSSGDTIAGAAAVIPTADAARAAVVKGTKTRDRLPIVFYGALGAAATTAFVLRVDPDSGGYHDGWTTATDFPDKAIHALAAWAITTVGIDFGARPRYAALSVCAAGTAFEFAQGYVSPYDIAADCVGAAGAAAFQSWRAKRRARAAKSAGPVAAR